MTMKESSREKERVAAVCFPYASHLFPVKEVTERAFWIILFLSMIFILFLYWDTVDEIKWKVPVGMAGLVALLFGISRFLNYRHKRGLVNVADRITEVEVVGKIEMVSVTLNPLQNNDRNEHTSCP